MYIHRQTLKPLSALQGSTASTNIRVNKKKKEKTTTFKPLGALQGSTASTSIRV
jgi:hypothetical protein